MRLTTPTYEHDCEGCNYMATSLCSSGVLHDWYFHKGDHPMGNTLIARYGNEPQEYLSWNVEMLKRSDARTSYRGMTVINEQTVVAQAMLELI